MGFPDRSNYLAMASHPGAILSRNLSSGWLDALVNEPIWLVANMGLGQFLSPEEVIRSVIFLGAFVFSYVFLRAGVRNWPWLVIFLFTPQIMKNFTTHLRQGLAIAIFLAGYFSHNRARGWLLMGASPFIHASFFLILPVTAIPEILKRLQVGVDVRILVLASFTLTVGLTLGIVAQFLGARQGEQYEFQLTTISGLGFVFWLGILALFVLQGSSFLRRYTVEVGILLFYLTSYFLIEVTARIFESGMPLVLLAGLALTAWRRVAFISALLSYGAIQWIMQPLLPAAL
jgi:hypothetical protein